METSAHAWQPALSTTSTPRTSRGDRREPSAHDILYPMESFSWYVERRFGGKHDDERQTGIQGLREGTLLFGRVGTLGE